MFSFPGSVVPLTALTRLGTPAGTDILPIQRTSPMQSATVAEVQAFTINSVMAYGAVGDGVTDDHRCYTVGDQCRCPLLLPRRRLSDQLDPAIHHRRRTHGQVMRGAGPTAIDGNGAAKAVIRPGGGVSVAIKIDGTPFGDVSAGVWFRRPYH